MKQKFINNSIHTHCISSWKYRNKFSDETLHWNRSSLTTLYTQRWLNYINRTQVCTVHIHHTTVLHTHCISSWKYRNKFSDQTLPKYQCKLPSLSLSGKLLKWVDCIKYLGITFTSSKVFSVDLNLSIMWDTSFFGCTNSILTHSSGVSELIKLHLMES